MYCATVLSSSSCSFLTKVIGESIVTGKSSRALIIPVAITLLYLPNVIGGYVQWKNANAVIGARGKSTTKDLIETLNTYLNNYILNEICEILPLIVSDGLLVSTSSITLNFTDNSQIWRCFKIWNSSLRVIALSLFLLLTETGNISLHLFTTQYLYPYSTLSNRPGF